MFSKFGYKSILTCYIFSLRYIGLEEFEDKIDKIAGGADSGEGSWLGSLYKKFKGSFLEGNGMDETADAGVSMDGMEPPILDETWGLDDVKTLFNSASE